MSIVKKIVKKAKNGGKFALGLIKPSNFGKARQILKTEGPQGFKKRLAARLSYSFVSQTLSYRDYLKFTRPTDLELEEQRQREFKFRPVFGVVIPAYNTRPEYLQNLLESFEAQTYGGFKLFIVDASPVKDDETAVTPIIKPWLEKDKRIIYKILGENLGIAANTNRAIDLAMEDKEVTHIALCDHDDYLEPDTLYWYADALDRDQNIKIIYSDEDKVAYKNDPDAYYTWKPDYDRFYLESCNYINHFFACDKELLKKIRTKDGEYERPEFDGAQDYDLYLRLVEEAEKLDQKLRKQDDKRIKDAVYTSSTIYHIPKFLYHWRAGEESTAKDPTNKLYAFEAGKRALEEHFKREGIKNASVEYTKAWGTYRIRYELKDQPLVTVMIPNKDHIADLDKAINSLKSGNYKNLQFLIVENNSEDPATFAYYDKIQKDPTIKVVYYEGDFNYSAINNFGAKHIKSGLILLLNNDIEMIEPNSISEMVAIIQRKNVGAVGAQLLYPNGKIQHAGVTIGLGGSAGHIFYEQKPEFTYGNRAISVCGYSAVTAACLLVKKEIYDKVGGLDEDFVVTFNDVDFCLKIRGLGFDIVYDPYAKFYHHESKSRGDDRKSEEKYKRMLVEAAKLNKKWPKILQAGDPYYNKNLTLSNPYCTLRERSLEE